MISIRCYYLVSEVLFFKLFSDFIEYGRSCVCMFFCWLAGQSYKGKTWQLNHFVVKTHIPATALAAILTTMFHL